VILKSFHLVTLNLKVIKMVIHLEIQMDSQKDFLIEILNLMVMATVILKVTRLDFPMVI